MTETKTIDIDTMPAGREMDALVDIEIMGLDVCVCKYVLEWLYRLPFDSLDPCHQCGKPFAKHRSTSIAAAWEVVEKFRKEETPMEVTSGFFGPYSCRIASNHGWLAMVQADTAPLAICRAALKAKQ